MRKKPVTDQAAIRWVLRFRATELSDLIDTDLRELAEQAFHLRDTGEVSVPYADRHEMWQELREPDGWRWKYLGGHPQLVSRSPTAWTDLLDVQRLSVVEPLAKTRTDLVVWQGHVRSAITELRETGAWHVPGTPSGMAVLLRANSRRLERRYRGDSDWAFCARVADLLLAWWEYLRECQGPNCDNPFLPEDPRKKYCSLKCEARARNVRYAPKRKKLKRDYAEEYKQRLAAKGIPDTVLKKMLLTSSKRGRRRKAE